MEKPFVRIGSSTPSGELQMDKDSLCELYESAYDDIRFMPKGMERIHKMLSLAEFCYQHKLDYEAYKLYFQVFRSFSWTCEGEERILFEQAVEGLSALCCSDNECVWEMCSQVVGDYMIWKREQEEQK